MDPLWLRFILSAAGVIFAGSFIGRVSGEIGDRMHLGRAWAGAVLIAIATSLPEVVAVATIALLGKFAMAVGAILGSITLNLTILVFVDFVGSESIYRRASRNHLATGFLGCALLGLLIAGLAFRQSEWSYTHAFELGHVGLFTIAIGLLYWFGQHFLFALSRKNYHDTGQMELETGLSHWPNVKIFFGYLFLVVAIFVASYNLGVSADQLTVRYGWGATFAGATLVGVITSLPEMTNGLVCAVRKEYDLALGDILGSNAFVFIVLVLVDVVTVRGPVLGLISSKDATASMIMAALAIVMQGVVLVALAMRSVHRIWRVSVASLLLFALYAANLVIAYRFGISH